MKRTKFFNLGLLIQTDVADLFGIVNSVKPVWAVLQPLLTGFFKFMLGTSPRFSRFEVPEFILPDTVYLPECELKNERHFIEFLIRNDWIQRRLGIKMFPSNGLFPDINGEIYDGTGDAIKVEIEYRAESFNSHGHYFKGCDLIISFLRKQQTRFIKGIPVWSFYIDYMGEHTCDLVLNNDINTDFDKLSLLSDEDYFILNRQTPIAKEVKKKHPKNYKLKF